MPHDVTYQDSPNSTEKEFDFSFVDAIARVALYDDMKSAPRITKVEPAATNDFIEHLTTTIYEQSRLADSLYADQGSFRKFHSCTIQGNRRFHPRRWEHHPVCGSRPRYPGKGESPAARLFICNRTDERLHQRRRFGFSHREGLP